MIGRPALLAVVLPLVPLAVACGGAADTLCAAEPALCAAAAAAGEDGVGTVGAQWPDAGSGGSSAATFRGDGSRTPKWGGWAYGNVPAEAVAKAGFEWFETGYPDAEQAWVNGVLQDAGVRPFAYINLGELHNDLRAASRYTGPILRTNGDWGTLLVDVTHPSWQDWLVRRAGEAYDMGWRGVKWDVATPDVPPGKTRADVNAAIASVMERIRAEHPDMKFVFNQGFEFVLAYPHLADGLQTEGLFSTHSFPAAFLQPWLDPHYWGPQFDQVKAVQQLGVPVIIAEYTDPWSQTARALYDAIVEQGFVPYITSDRWNVRGMGLGIQPGW